MPRGIKSDLEPHEVVERDLEWLKKEAGFILSKKMRAAGGVDEDVVVFLRGLARTAQKSALFHTKRLGMAKMRPGNTSKGARGKRGSYAN